jgi:hypothetical protein
MANVIRDGWPGGVCPAEPSVHPDWDRWTELWSYDHRTQVGQELAAQAKIWLARAPPSCRSK